MQHVEQVDRSASEHKDADGKADLDPKSCNARGDKVRTLLRARLGEDIFSSWFASIEFESFDGRAVRATVPVKFLKSWIQSHYAEDLLACCASEFKGVSRVDLDLRMPGLATQRPAAQQNAVAMRPRTEETAQAEPRRMVMTPGVAATSSLGRTHVNGFEGSPLDPRYTFESFVVGACNRMAHAAATQVAETVLADDRGFNPLYIHASVGLGKTHLLHAIAWEVKRRAPKAQVLYLTAERFRYQFVEAIKSQDAMAFKDKFRAIDILLIDDLEFMRGEKTEQEFEHIINALLDGGRQVVVASARPPALLDGLNDRMRSRLQRGLVTELIPMDASLRLKVIEKRVQEKRSADASFEISGEVVNLLADRLTESGRELEGAINRLYLTWQLMRAPISLDIAETVIRDLVQGVEPRRIKIEDILRVVSRHYAVSKQDILSQRRHRSVVRPRQVGMYLAKHLTSRSLPEIGRRFGDRDHTTVLHAIRKIDKEVGENPRLKDEIEDLKRQLSR
ncbi:MAG: chromosomal replication initiator protein DnaA [Hyphomicrobiaceae bacterium]|nr:chromosomal replication initiator protein DnaA [Hyphomicrobiaceae bacterium]